MMKKVNKRDAIIALNYLFKDVWPAMEGCAVNKKRCIAHAKDIVDAINNHLADADKMLPCLIEIEGIGVTIGTGIIHAFYPEEFVPFDKYTTGYAIGKRIIGGKDVSKNFTKYSQKVVSYINDKREDIESILEFVREAGSNTAFPISPE